VLEWWGVVTQLSVENGANEVVFVRKVGNSVKAGNVGVGGVRLATNVGG